MHSREYQPPVTTERMFGSTTWHWKDGSLRRAPARNGTGEPKASSIYALRTRDPRKSLDLQIRYIGGPEGSWTIQARGWKWTFTGALAVADVMAWINRSDG